MTKFEGRLHLMVDDVCELKRQMVDFWRRIGRYPKGSEELAKKLGPGTAETLV